VLSLLLVSQYGNFSKGLRMVSIKAQHHHIAQDTTVNRVNQAFERLQNAWDAVRAQRSADGTTQFDEAALNELDAAEEEWLTARAAASVRS
jgi:primosomal protein N''